jgi:alpha-tubulin suppressor-like RCC1 family protein
VESNVAQGATKRKPSLFDSRNKKFLAIFIVLIAIAGIYIIYRSFASTGVVMTGAEGEFTPVAPARVLDTRNGSGGLKPFAANAEQTLKLTANAGIPASNVSSVVVNLTVVNAPADGFVTIWPSGESKPSTSNINFKSGQTIANQVTVKVGADGKIKMLSNASGTNLLIDVSGYYSAKDGNAGSRFSFTAPTRILDTRSGTGAPKAQLGDGQSINVKVAGIAGVPADAKAVTLTLTAVAPSASGYMTVWPSGSEKPVVSNINYAGGVNIANQVTAPIGADGSISLFNAGSKTDAIFDIIGYYKPAASGTETSQQGRYYAVTPERVYDSRTSNTPLAGGATREISISSKSSKPNYTSGVSTNAVVINPSASGYFTAWQSSTPRPNSSNINFSAGSTQASGVTVATAPNKTTTSINTFINNGQANLALDLNGYFAADYQANYQPPAGSSTANLTGVKEVSSAIYHTCSLINDGIVKCWGSTALGQLGYGITENTNNPTTISGLTGATQVSAGGAHTCSLIFGGTVKCWGYIIYSEQPGQRANLISHIPTTVSGLTGATQVSAGGAHTCSLISGGTVKCWGNNYQGQLGDGTKAYKTTPVTVSGLTGVTQVSTGSGHSCALISGGTVKCWGYNSQGQLGDGTTVNKPTPVTVSGLTGATQVSTGSGHSCALISGGTVKCWGGNRYGQLGDGTTSNKSTPVTVSGLTGATQVSAGDDFACAVITGGTVKCWGNNENGQLGDGTTANKSTPAIVSRLGGVTQLSAGWGRACAVISGGTVKCWGNDHLSDFITPPVYVINPL